MNIANKGYSKEKYLSYIMIMLVFLHWILITVSLNTIVYSLFIQHLLKLRASSECYGKVMQRKIHARKLLVKERFIFVFDFQKS